MKETNKKNKMETSKKILLASYIIAIILTAIVVVGSFMYYDVSHIVTITCLAWGEIAVTNSHYYKKASKENVIKIASNLDENFKEQVDINQLLNQ